MVVDGGKDVVVVVVVCVEITVSETSFVVVVVDTVSLFFTIDKIVSVSVMVVMTFDEDTTVRDVVIVTVLYRVLAYFGRRVDLTVRVTLSCLHTLQDSSVSVILVKHS